MAASQKTTNYDLSIYAGTDIMEPLKDFNGNMNIIDEAMKENADAASSASNSVSSIRETVETLQTTVQTLQATVQELESTISEIKTLKVGDTLQLRADNTVALVTYK